MKKQWSPGAAFYGSDECPPVEMVEAGEIKPIRERAKRPEGPKFRNPMTVKVTMSGLSLNVTQEKEELMGKDLVTIFQQVAYNKSKELQWKMDKMQDQMNDLKAFMREF